jgi:hypothetical protein
MPSMPDYENLFRNYAAAYERSLGATVDSPAIRGFFAEAFIAAGLNGEVKAGANDDGFEAVLQQGYRFYKALGTRRMRVDRIEAHPICEQHDRVRVFYVADYQKKDGSRVSIPFDVVYLLQRRADGPKIFGFIAGDEMALYRRYGLVDDQGKPA